MREQTNGILTRLNSLELVILKIAGRLFSGWQTRFGREARSRCLTMNCLWRFGLAKRVDLRIGHPAQVFPAF